MTRLIWTGLVLGAVAVSCGRSPAPGPPATPVPGAGTFGADLERLRTHTPIVLLTSADGRSQVAVAPGYQGRVMTSTATGPEGPGYGYLHWPGITAGTRQPHMTVLGGEDRFWLGPEGGQFALFFAPGTSFDTDHWQTPEPIDWGAWPVTSQDPRQVTFEQPMSLTNYAGTRFDLRVDRRVRLLDREEAAGALGQSISGAVQVVAFESDNRVTNTGRAAWRRDSGLVSIWILGMFRPAPRVTVVLPYQAGRDAERGPVVNDAYFGAIGADRLYVGPQAIVFRGDGLSRGKIGVPRPRARDVAGSYDPDAQLLTLVQFSLPAEARDYVNSMWAHQASPYAGDVVNSYNDGPIGPGQPPLGPFYEVESSSPAAALAPGGTLGHVHRTLHLQGPESELDRVSRAVLGVSLQEIVSSLPAARP